MAWIISLNIAATVVAATVLAGLYAGNHHNEVASPPPAASTTAAPGSAAPTTTSSAPTTPAPGSASVPGTAPLSSLNPIQEQGIANFTTGTQQIGGATYQNSIRFTVTADAGQYPYLAYNVSGYNFLTATVGVPDDATNAVGNTMTITFFRNNTNYQLGSAAISSGQLQAIHLNLQGAAQLVIACAATDSAGQRVSMDVAFGNAVLGAS